MLKFRSASDIIFFLAALVLLLTIYRADFGWLLVPLAFTWITILVIGSVRVCSQFYMPVFCRSVKAEKRVSLTFDDGPDPEKTPLILEILEKHDVKAAFFLIGLKTDTHPEIVTELLNKGHEVGIHSYSHDIFFDLYGKKKMERDLVKSVAAVFEATGKKPEWFRPPYGVTNPVLAKAVNKLDLKAIGWSVRSLDTTIKDENKLIARVMRKVRPGAVVLLHDTQDVTVNALERIIVKIREDGYRFVGIEEMTGFKSSHRMLNNNLDNE